MDHKRVVAVTDAGVDNVGLVVPFNFILWHSRAAVLGHVVRIKLEERRTVQVFQILQRELVLSNHEQNEQSHEWIALLLLVLNDVLSYLQVSDVAGRPVLYDVQDV